MTLTCCNMGQYVDSVDCLIAWLDLLILVIATFSILLNQAEEGSGLANPFGFAGDENHFPTERYGSVNGSGVLNT